MIASLKTDPLGPSPPHTLPELETKMGARGVAVMGALMPVAAVGAADDTELTDYLEEAVLMSALIVVDDGLVVDVADDAELLVCSVVGYL